MNTDRVEASREGARVVNQLFGCGNAFEEHTPELPQTSDIYCFATGDRCVTCGGEICPENLSPDKASQLLATS